MNAERNEHLFGQLLLERGFLTREQLQEGLARQAREGKALGSVLVESGVLTQERLDEALELQKSRFERIEADPARGGLFGQLALRLGYLTPDALHDALREQEIARGGLSSLRLGQLLLQKQRLTTDQFLDILRRQRKDVAPCPNCHAFYEVGQGGTLDCPVCHAVVRA